MGATISPLSIALSGLRVAQAQISVTSNNIANVSTDGYSRKVLHQYTNLMGDQGAGADTGVIQRNINHILLRDYRTQIARTTALETKQGYMDQIQEIHGPPDAQQSISAYIGKLKDAFAQLANQPESTYLINHVYTTATQVVEKMSDFSQRVVEMRNNAQAEMTHSVARINALTEQIATLNISIKVATTQNRTVAELADQRDIAIRELSKEIEVSYFETMDGVVTVMTKTGQPLVDTIPNKVYFAPSAIGAGTYYPVNAAGIMLGNPITGNDLAADTKLGGRLGALVELRDTILPVYQAQIDELAHKLATRFQAEGLTLFTMPNGTVPANNPAAYTGFAADMVVNPDIVADRTLVRKGTDPLSTVQTGSNEVLRRVVEFTFGDVAYQRGLGNVPITTGPATLFAELGITGQARVIGDTNIQAMGVLENSPHINPGVEDTFTIQIGGGPIHNITITPGMTASTLVGALNAAHPGIAQLSSGGQLILTADADIDIGVGTLGINGLAELGFEAGLTVAQPPSFRVGAGTNELTTITILPTDTGADLLYKINQVPGVPGIVASITVPDGYLQITPTQGGDITVIDGLGTPMTALGLAITDVPHAAFNVSGVGPAGTLSTGIQTATSVHDYATQAIGLQSQEAQSVDLAVTTEANYRAALQKQFLDTSGVNLDEEMALLINIQTAYNASARTIRVVEEMLDELMNTMR